MFFLVILKLHVQSAQIWFISKVLNW